MMRRSYHAFALTAALALSWGTGPAVAEEFVPVESQAEFVGLIEGRALTRFGISLSVRPDGAIEGSAFGMAVSGAWNWQGQYFCRDLRYGNTALEPNCQAVLVKGETLRFIADRGKGDSADLRLR